MTQLIVIIIITILFGATAIISSFLVSNNRTYYCQRKCSSINESYAQFGFDDDNNLVCYCKPKLHVVDGIVR